MHSFLKSSLDELSTITLSNPDIHLLVEQAKDQLHTEVLDYDSITTPFILSFLSLKKLPDVIFRNIKYFLETDKIRKDTYPQLLKCIVDRGYKDMRSLQIASLLAYKLTQSELLVLFKYVYGIKSQESDMICKQIILIVIDKYKNSNDAEDNTFCVALNENSTTAIDDKESINSLKVNLNSPKNDCISLFNLVVSLNNLELIDLFLENVNFLDKNEIFNKVEKRIKTNFKDSIKLLSKLEFTNEIKQLIFNNLLDYKVLSKYFLNVALNQCTHKLSDYSNDLYLINEYILIGYTLNTKPKEEDILSNLPYFSTYYNITNKINKLTLCYDNKLVRELSKQNTASFVVLYLRIMEDKEIILNILSMLDRENDIYLEYYTSLLKISQKEGIDMLNTTILGKVIEKITDYEYLVTKSKEMDEALLIELLNNLTNEGIKIESLNDTALTKNNAPIAVYLTNIERLIPTKYNIFSKLDYLDTYLVKEYLLQCNDLSKEIETLPFDYLSMFTDSTDLLFLIEEIIKYKMNFNYIYREILLLVKKILQNNSSDENIKYIINIMSYFINEVLLYTDLIDESLDVIILLHDLCLYKDMGTFLLNSTTHQEKYLLLLLEENESFLDVLFWFIRKSNVYYKSVFLKLFNYENRKVISFINDYLKDSEVIEEYIIKSKEYLTETGTDNELAMIYLEGLSVIIKNTTNELTMNNKLNSISESVIKNETIISNESVSKVVRKESKKRNKNKVMKNKNNNEFNKLSNEMNNINLNNNIISNEINNIIFFNDVKLSFDVSFYNRMILLLKKNDISIINRLLNNNINLNINILIEVINHLICKECICNNYEESMFISLKLLKQNHLFIKLINDNIKEVNDDLFDKLSTVLLCLIFNEEKSELQSLILDLLISLINSNNTKVLSIKSISNKIYNNINDEYLLVKYFTNLNEEYLDLFIKIINNERHNDTKISNPILLVTLSYTKIYNYNITECINVSSLLINNFINTYKVYERLTDKRICFITKHVLNTLRDKEILLKLKNELFGLMRIKCFINELEKLFNIMLE